MEWKYKKGMFRKEIAGVFFCLAFLLAGCGKKEPDAGDPNQLYCHFHETAIPDPDEALGSVFEQGYNIVETDRKLFGDTLYRIVFCATREEPFQSKYFVQVLKLSDREWITQEVRFVGAPEAIIDEKEGVLTVLEYNPEQDRYTYSLTRWKPGEDGLEQVQDSGFESTEEEFETAGEFFTAPDGGYCYYNSYTGSVVLCDGSLRPTEKKELGGNVWISGLIQEPESGELLWYGLTDREPGVWKLEDGTSVIEAGQSLGTVSAADFRAVYGADGALYLADTQALWRMADGKLTQICRFLDRDYPLTALYEMEVQEDGSLLLEVESTEEEFALQIEINHEPLPEKREITMASQWTGQYSLDSAIAKFNRTQETYHVTVEYPYDFYADDPYSDHSQEEEAFRDRIQMEISAGRGPDLYFCKMNYGIIDPEDMARGGYLQDLEGIVKEEDGCWPAALEVGKIDGVQYGIPFSCSLTLAAYSRSLAKERSSWTLPELMDEVRKSGVEVLDGYLSGPALVLYYGLYDNDNREFIDWEKGESHLDEEPFKEFLAFAKEYSGDGDSYGPGLSDAESLKKDIAEGRTAGCRTLVTISNWGVIWDEDDDSTSLENIFSGDPVCIGYPRSQGNGIYVLADMIYMNANSENREGVEELLRYLLSEETQRRICQRYLIGNMGTSPGFPVRFSTLEETIETALERKKKGEKGSYLRPALTEEQAQTARFLLENARPGNFRAEQVESIIYEELEPYFQDRRSLEETVEILDNRVQLYLDER